VEVGSLVSGRIKELRADYNSIVTAGEVIAIIDPQLFESAVAQARARLAGALADRARARAVEANARLEHERLAGLMKSGVSAKADVDRAHADLLSAQAQTKAAQAAITLARAALEQARVNLEYTTIRSPIDGIVVSRNVDVGQSVAASLQAPTLFVIAEDLRKMEVHTSVAESDVGQLAPGTLARFTVDAYPTETFEGVVKEVRYEAITISNVVTYDALISVDNRDLKLRPGMTANVDFVLEEHKDVLVVPNRALRYRPSDSRLADESAGNQSPASGRRRSVYLLVDGKPRRASIAIGLTDGVDTEVVDGSIEDGDRIVVAEGTGVSAPGNERRRGPPRVF
jgi:HlyD family secretion protein